MKGWQITPSVNLYWVLIWTLLLLDEFCNSNFHVFKKNKYRVLVRKSPTSDEGRNVKDDWRSVFSNVEEDGVIIRVKGRLAHCLPCHTMLCACWNLGFGFIQKGQIKTDQSFSCWFAGCYYSCRDHLVQMWGLLSLHRVPFLLSFCPRVVMS